MEDIDDVFSFANENVFRNLHLKQSRIQLGFCQDSCYRFTETAFFELGQERG